MKTFLNLLLSLLVVIAVWRVAFHSPSPLASAQDPDGNEAAERRATAGDDPFGGPTTPGDPFGGAPATDDPFGGPATGGDNDSRPRGRSMDEATGGNDRSGAKRDARLQPYVQDFRVELIDVTDDGQSLRKREVRGAARVKPVSRNELPEVDLNPAIEVIGLGSKGVQSDDMDGEGMGMDDYGGSDEMMGYGGEGMGGRRSSQHWRALDERHRQDVLQRVTWQAQADWVRRVIGSRDAPNDAAKESLKTRSVKYSRSST